MTVFIPQRRRFIGGLAAAGLALAGGAAPAAKGKKDEEVAPGEDLMREHGILRRVMLAYDEIIRRLGAGEELPADAVVIGAGIIRRVIEDYHEKLEEEYLFPRFEKAGKLVELVRVLRDQHQAGRHLTEHIQGQDITVILNSAGDRKKLVKYLLLFIRMYRPHKAREDTVLFPAFHSIVSPDEYARLGDEFEDREHALFGEKGFETIVDKVGGLEEVLGIYELAEFTPKIL